MLADDLVPAHGRIQGRVPLLKLEKNMICWRKIVIFRTKYPQIVRASLRSAQQLLFEKLVCANPKLS
jgi:hypothetical protein